jgi:antitoxin PrlF
VRTPCKFLPSAFFSPVVSRVGPGEKIEADKLPDGRIVVRAAAPNGTISDFIGCLSQKKGPKLTVDEMNAIAAQEWAKAK